LPPCRYGDLARSEQQKIAFEKIAAEGGLEPYVDVRRAPVHRAQQTRNTHVKKRQDAAERERLREAEQQLHAARQQVADELSEKRG